MSAPGTTAATAQGQQDSITHAVTQIFSDLKRDMDTIVNSAGLDAADPSSSSSSSAAAEQQTTGDADAAAVAAEEADEPGPILRLGHRRTESEAPGYDDYQLPHPLAKLPEVLSDAAEASTTQHSQTAGPTMQAAAAAAGPSSRHISSTVTAAGAEAAAARQGGPATAGSMPAHLSSPRLRPAVGSEPMHAARYQQHQELQQELQQELRQLQAEVGRANMLLTAPGALSGGLSGGDTASAESSEGGAAPSQGSGRQLSYRELLDRALAWNPRVKGAGPFPNSSGGGSSSSSVRASIDTASRRVSSVSTASGGSSFRRQRPSSTGRMQSAGRFSGMGPPSPPEHRSRPHYMQQGAAQYSPPQQPQHQHSRSKFPASQQQQQQQQRNSHFSMAEQHVAASQPWCSAAAGSRMFDVACRMQGAVQDRSPQRLRGPYRSRSAPREEAAARRHIERMQGSPTRAAPAAAVRDSILGAQQQQLLLQQQGLLPWQQQRSSQASGSSRSSAAFSSPTSRKVSARSPDGQLPMRLTDEEWDKVTTRLHQYTTGKLKHAPADGPRSPSTSPGPAERPAAPLNPDFYRRQDRLLRRRAELAASKRRSDEDDLTECTFHPQINPASRNLQRSVEQLHAWDARRKLTVFAKALDKCEHEGEGYSFMPSINPLSRQLALANYAVAPDPARPWTTKVDAASTSPRRSSPRRNSPSPDAVRMLRDALPPAHVIMMAGPTAQQKAESVMDLLGGLAAAPPASTRHYAHSTSSSAAPGVDELLLGRDSPSHGPQEAQHRALTVCADLREQLQGEAPTAPAPVGAEAAAGGAQRGSNAGAGDSDGSAFDASADAGDGAIVIRLTADQLLEKGLSAASGDHNHPLEPQLLLAALKLSPVQAQQGLEEGKSRVSANGTAHPTAHAAGSGAAAVAAAAVRGSSSGGMAPGTPVMGSLGGSAGSGGGGGACIASSVSPFAKPGLGPMRDDSAAGGCAGARAKKLTAGGSNLGAAAAAGAAHKQAASSPLSRSKQQGAEDAHSPSPKGHPADKDCNGSSTDATLQDLAQHWGCAGPADKLAQQMRLQTVPACYYASADTRSPRGGAEMGKRPASSYSQKYQQRLSAGGAPKQGLSAGGSPPAAPELSPELLGSRRNRSSSSGGGGYAARSSDCESPTFAQLKARWMAKESASEAGGGPPGSGPNSPTKSSAGGAALGASVAAAEAALESLLGCSLGVAGPETPLHSQQRQSPFAPQAGVFKQYSTAQVLNARARHSSSGGAYAAAESAAGQEQHGTDGCCPSALQADVHGDVQVVVLLTSDTATNAEAASGSATEERDGSANGAEGSSQALAACFSVLSVPDAAAGCSSSAAAESCNGCPRAIVTQKVEVLLEGTRSVPFELVLSPRSKGLLALTYGRGRSSSGGSPGPTCVDIASPLGQHLMQLLAAGRMSDGGEGSNGAPLAVTLTVSQWQQLQQQHKQWEGPRGRALAAVAEPVLSSPAASAVTQLLDPPTNDSSVRSEGAGSDGSSASGAPAHTQSSPAATGADAAGTAFGGAGHPGSNERMVMQLLRPAAASPHLLRSDASTPVWGTPTSSRATLSTPQQLQQQQGASAAGGTSCGNDIESMAASSSPSAPVAAAGPAAATGAADAPQQQPQQDETADLAAELVQLLQSAGSMSPEEKADRVARTFAKTISRLNMSSDVLHQTIATLGTAAPLPAAAPGSSTAAPGQDTAPAGVVGASPAVAASAATAAAAAAASAAAEANLPGLDGLSDMSEADNIQQLLERVS